MIGATNSNHQRVSNEYRCTCSVSSSLRTVIIQHKRQTQCFIHLLMSLLWVVVSIPLDEQKRTRKIESTTNEKYRFRYFLSISLFPTLNNRQIVLFVRLINVWLIALNFWMQSNIPYATSARHDDHFYDKVSHGNRKELSQMNAQIMSREIK